MFIRKENMPAGQFEKLSFGSEINATVNGRNVQKLIVTRLGVISVEELQPHPYNNFYQNPNADFGKNASFKFFNEDMKANFDNAFKRSKPFYNPGA